MVGKGGNMDKFKHSHKLGQNFLNNSAVLIKIIDSVDVNEEDLVIEIGPGQGALTKYLKLYKANLICFEVDDRLKKYLSKFEDNITKIYFEDFMNIDLKKILENIKYKKLYIMANLPYYITTPIIEKVIDSSVEVEAMVLMVQKEVADRLSAKPGRKEYGAITAYLNYFYKIEKIIDVGRKNFTPVPNVDSAILKFTKVERDIEKTDLAKLKALIYDSFRMKRKNIKNNLSNYNIDDFVDILEKYNIKTSDRAESIPIECFIEMANKI